MPGKVVALILCPVQMGLLNFDANYWTGYTYSCESTSMLVCARQDWALVFEQPFQTHVEDTFDTTSLKMRDSR